MMTRLSVRTRILVTVAFAAAALVLVGVLGYRTSTGVSDTMRMSHETYFLGVKALGELNVELHAGSEALLASIVARTPEGARAGAEQIRQSSAEVDALWKWYRDSTVTDEDRRLGDAFSAAHDAYRRGVDEVMQLVASNRYDEAAQLSQSSLVALRNSCFGALEKLLDYNVRTANELLQESERSFARSTVLIWLSILTGAALSGLCGWLLVRSIMRGLDAARLLASRIAEGRLGNDVAITSEDEFGALLSSLKQMDAKLHEIVTGVRSASDSVGGAASQLSRGNDDLSQRTQEQAAALEETASSMEQMTATVKQNADNARQANQLATGARIQAERGGAVVTRAVDAMQEINAASSRIADIISVIDGIAFQTNLLALNAAVEAARAGEQGRGFAVVASEVRSLAQRSAAAAKEIKELIGDSVQKVRTGAELVDDSGKALAEIMESVKKVSDIVAEIAAASEEQSSGIEQVNNAVTQMDQTTQQNAALVEEATAAAKAMEQQARELMVQIAFFRAGERAPQPAAHSTSASAAPANVTPLRKSTIAKAAPVRSAARAPAAKASGDDSVWREF